MQGDSLSLSYSKNSTPLHIADDTVEVIDISIQTQCRLLKPQQRTGHNSPTTWNM